MKTMNRVWVIGLTASVVCTGSLARGEGPDHGLDLFRSNELSVDFFGTGSIGEQTIDNISGTRVRENGRLGAGAGINFFFTRNFGLGADAYSENTDHSFVDSASVNFIARMPLGGSGFSPYIFGGATRQFDNVLQWGGDGGGGFEFRFAHNWALFVDARYVLPDRTDNYGVGRGGVRISF